MRGTEDLELTYEIVQPDGGTDNLSVYLRRKIGLVRLSGDDRNDRDLRLVQGSALDRLLSDNALRSRLASELAKSDVAEQLTDDAKKILEALNQVFKKKSLPDELDLAITGGQGLSISALIGLTANREEFSCRSHVGDLVQGASPHSRSASRTKVKPPLHSWMKSSAVWNHIGNGS